MFSENREHQEKLIFSFQKKKKKERNMYTNVMSAEFLVLLK